MFGSSRKKEQSQKVLSENEQQFINTIITSLNSKYKAFVSQEHLKVIAYITPNKMAGDGSFVFGINNGVWKKISDSTKDNFIIKNVKFKDKRGQDVVVELYTTEGLWVGFGTTAEINSIDLSTINIDQIWEKHFLNNDYSEIENLLSSLPKDELKKLNLVKNTFKIDIGNSSYFPVHDIGDGNYLAIDRSGSVFKITHDPFEVKKLYSSVIEMLTNYKEEG